MGFGSSLAVKIIGIVIVLFIIIWLLNSLLGGVKDFVKMLNPVNWFKDGGVFKPVGNFLSGGANKVEGGLRKGGSAAADWLGGKGNPLWQDEENLDGNVL